VRLSLYWECTFTGLRTTCLMQRTYWQAFLNIYCNHMVRSAAGSGAWTLQWLKLSFTRSAFSPVECFLPRVLPITSFAPNNKWHHAHNFSPSWHLSENPTWLRNARVICTSTSHTSFTIEPRKVTEVGFLKNCTWIQKKKVHQTVLVQSPKVVLKSGSLFWRHKTIPLHCHLQSL